MADKEHLPGSNDPSSKSARLIRPHHIVIAGVFTAVIICLLLIAHLGMRTLSSARAYVGGEGFWSKAQKDAVHYLLRYGRTGSETDFLQYLESIAVPLADREARLELEKPGANLEKAAEAFVRGRNHPDDALDMARLFRTFRRQQHLDRAIAIWAEGDTLIERLQRLGLELQREMTAASPDQTRVHQLLAEIDALNEQFPRLEDQFSQTLGDASRWSHGVVVGVMSVGAVLLLALGLGCSYKLMVRARDADDSFLSLLQNASDAIILADAKSGVILDANAKLEELTGIPSAQIRGAFQAALFGREIPTTPGYSNAQVGDQVIRHVDGRSIPVDVRANQGRYKGRAVVYSIVRDMRERRQLEEELREAARLESVGRLAGGVAHDFNNLLTVISGYGQVLARKSAGEFKQKIEHMLQATADAAALVRQLLAFSRRQPLQPQALNLNRVVANMQRILTGFLTERIDLFLDLAPDLANVEVDRVQVEQILINLASNARDAMPEGGTLKIRTRNMVIADQGSGAASPATAYVGLSVTDNGHGMDEETRSRIFEPFFTTKQLGKGTGLGLSTVYGTVTQSKGRIAVTSSPGNGATFMILLPAVTAEAAGETAIEDGDDLRGSETLLLVEDDTAVRHTLACSLAQEGYTVLEACNGREALEVYSQNRGKIALIVTDLLMPQVSGAQLGKRLAEAGEHVRLLYLSGYPDDIRSPQNLPLSAGFLLKPFGHAGLARAVRRALDAPGSFGGAQRETNVLASGST
ncbi:MAG: hybrid sensor histidine kinase/response regulator [Bryobacteraceae bacterium]